MRGIILAGGSGSRLHPMTLAVSKQLLPVSDKPLVYYPLSAPMLTGVREIVVIPTPEDLVSFERLLGSGAQWGLEISCAAQPRPEGLAQAYVIGAEFVEGCKSLLALGDKIFYGHGLADHLRRTAARESGATVFAFHVSDPERYGVDAFAPFGLAVTLEKRPVRPQSNWTVTGLYFYDARAALRGGRQAVVARRIGEHGSESRLLRDRRAQCRKARAQLRVARYGHAGLPGGSIGTA